MIPIPGGTTTIVAGVLAVAVGGYILHCEHVKRDRAGFIATLEAKAEAQEKENKRITKENDDRREKANAENTKLRTAHATISKRLRDERSRASLVPAAAPGAARPDVAAYDRAQLGRALSRFEEGIDGLLTEGDAALIDVNTARRWAQEAK